MTSIDWQRRAFLDVRGELRIIQACPLFALDEFADLLELMQAELSEDLDFSEYYRKNPFFRQIVHRCLALCGVDPDWLDIPMLQQMLFYRQGEGDILHPGALVELNFPKQERPTSGDKVSIKEAIAHKIAALWGQSGNLQEAIAVVQTVPADLLDAILQARTEQIDPKAATQKRLSQVAEKFEEQLKDDNLFGSFANFKPPIQ